MNSKRSKSSGGKDFIALNKERLRSLSQKTRLKRDNAAVSKPSKTPLKYSRKLKNRPAIEEKTNPSVEEAPIEVTEVLPEAVKISPKAGSTSSEAEPSCIDIQVKQSVSPQHVATRVSISPDKEGIVKSMTPVSLKRKRDSQEEDDFESKKVKT